MVSIILLSKWKSIPDWKSLTLKWYWRFLIRVPSIAFLHCYLVWLVIWLHVVECCDVAYGAHFGIIVHVFGLTQELTSNKWWEYYSLIQTNHFRTEHFLVDISDGMELGLGHPVVSIERLPTEDVQKWRDRPICLPFVVILCNMSDSSFATCWVYYYAFVL